MDQGSGINRVHYLKNIPIFILKAENDPFIGKAIDEQRLS